MKKAPCKDCTKRELGCHSVCDEYIEWKKYIDLGKQLLKNEADIDCFLKKQSQRRLRHPGFRKGR